MATVKEKAAKAEKAVETEVKKTRSRAKTAAEKVEAAVADIKDAAAATEIEAKKTVRKAARTAKAKAEEVKAAAEAVRPAALNIVIQSPMGGSITVEEIAAKLPEGAESVFVRVDHNKLYWVRGEETGAVDIW